MAYTPLRRYFRGHRLVGMQDVQANQMRYYHFDHQGTTQCLTDSTGAVTDRFAANAWGVQVKRTGTSINRQWYIGNLGYYRQVDRALDYVRARVFNPTSARWHSVDPILSGPVYSYGLNSPSAHIDPSGVQPPPGPAGTSLIWQTAGPPNVLRGCGGVSWPINWAIRSGSRTGLRGWVIQQVNVSGKAILCGDRTRTFLTEQQTQLPDGFTYWEAWPVADDGSMQRRGDDTFKTPGPVFRIGGNLANTEGCARVDGWAQYVQGGLPPTGESNLPGFGWKQCTTIRNWNINLMCTTEFPRGWTVHAGMFHRWVQIRWVCDSRAGCRCIECDYGPAIDGKHPDCTKTPSAPDCRQLPGDVGIGCFRGGGQ